MDRLADPKTALLDLEDCYPTLPVWLDPKAGERLEGCRDEATRSRKRVASVEPPPAFAGFEKVLHVVTPPVTSRQDGARPEVWSRQADYFTA